ncbi:MAG: ABC transporter ATP-binding protein [Methylocystaceae bacterium]|nr:MAG: ABC transporter ATP-binding protein [Methylocystaceae bacterium]
MASRDALLSVRSLNVSFAGAQARIDAVRDVSFDAHSGEVLAIIGESGSGKSTLARALIGMVQPTSGTIRLDGAAIAASARRRPRAVRRRIGMVFQDSGGAFDPRFSVRRILLEPLLLLGDAAPAEREASIERLLDDVGLSLSLADRLPHELSGGQRQRLGIARALASSPDLLICDEAVSALDVSVQAQILNLLDELQTRRRLTLIFITHDLGVVEYLADRIGVMHRGRLVEIGPAPQILNDPRHSYTRGMLTLAAPPAE